MERERQKPARHGGRRRPRRVQQPAVEPVIVAARRPRPNAVTQRPEASSEPVAAVLETAPSQAAEGVAPPARRSARIVAAPSRDGDATARERERLLSRLLASEGRSAITRAAQDFRRAGFDYPAEQPVLLQLLEHLDEAEVRTSLGALAGLLSREAPFKRPVFEQRLRRLEDGADEEATRRAAAELRRALRA